MDACFQIAGFVIESEPPGAGECLVQEVPEKVLGWKYDQDIYVKWSGSFVKDNLHMGYLDGEKVMAVKPDSKRNWMEPEREIEIKGNEGFLGSIQRMKEYI